MQSMLAGHKNSQTIGLVDCNNFFVSCERVFCPKLNNQPVLVLSNNDGCVVARSNESKALEIPMGIPVHKVQHLIHMHKIHTFSSNFELYGNLSSRVMSTIALLSPQVEVYSIDEAFLNLKGIDNLNQHVQMIQEKILQWTGIPASIGVASTKTLAKIANEYAKKHLKTKGIVVLDNEKAIDRLLSETDIQDIWGIGYRSANKLKIFGIFSALDLKNAQRKFIRKEFNVMLERTWMELNAIPCIALSESSSTRKSIIVSRSFRRKTNSFNELQEAVCTHMCSAAKKLRKYKLKTFNLGVSIRTSPYDKNREHYSNSAHTHLEIATNDSDILLEAAINSLKKIYRAGHLYQKAGVVLYNLIPEDIYQQNLFFKPLSDNSSLMRSMDQINNKYGRSIVTYAVSGFKKPWAGKSEKRSPNYTGSWRELYPVY